MHPAGLSVFVREVLTTGLFWQICVLVIILLLVCEYAVRWWTAKTDDMPTSLNGLSISTIVPFVRNRYDFLNWGFQNTGETVFRFRLFTVRHFLSALITLLTRWFHRNQWWPFPVKAADQRF
jgi:sterol 14-demethylase